MMSPQTIVLIVLGVLSVGQVVLQIASIGPLPLARRRLIERVMMWATGPALVVLSGMNGVMAASAGNTSLALMSGALVFLWAGQAATLYTRRPTSDGTRT